MNASPARLEVTCPKCNGERIVWAFRHIDNGRCFRCAGNGTILVGAEKAEQFIPAIKAAPLPPTAEIPGLGRCEVYADRIEVAGRNGGLPVYFERREGRIVVTAVCDGLKRRRSEVVAAVEAWGR